MRTALASLLLLPLLHCAAAHAALGAAPSNMGAVPLRQGGAVPALVVSSAMAGGGGAAAYSLSTSVLDTDTVVREYSDSHGVVFAISWSGPVLPDLRTLLGVHFATMRTAQAARPRAGNSQLALHKPEVVIISGGHMRAYTGRAWIPAALPAGFSTDSIE
jgi:hypothetical protein